MKNIKPLALLLIGFTILNSCEVEECDTNNHGSVTITNDLEEAYIYDVTYEKTDNGDWIDNYEVEIAVGQSYTWNEVGAGNVRIWIDKQIDSEDRVTWRYTEDTELSSCQDKDLKYENQCELFGTGDAIVVNETEWQIIVDVKTSEGHVEEVELAPNEQVTYYVPPGDIEYWARIVNTIEWMVSEPYPLEQCKEFTFTWSAKKSASYKKMAKPVDAKQYQCNKTVKK